MCQNYDGVIALEKNQKSAQNYDGVVASAEPSSLQVKCKLHIKYLVVDIHSTECKCNVKHSKRRAAWGAKPG